MNNMQFKLWVESRETDYYGAENIVARHHYKAQEKNIPELDLSISSIIEILDYLKKLEIPIPNDVSPELFAARIKSISLGNFDTEQDFRANRKQNVYSDEIPDWKLKYNDPTI